MSLHRFFLLLRLALNIVYKASPWPCCSCRWNTACIELTQYCDRQLVGCMRHGTCMSTSPLFPPLRSIRRSVRGGSVKLKQQNYDHLKENGDIGAMNRTSTSRKVQDLDIKMLQAKRQQAEMRRWGAEWLVAFFFHLCLLPLYSLMGLNGTWVSPTLYNPKLAPP